MVQSWFQNLFWNQDCDVVSNLLAEIAIYNFEFFHSALFIHLHLLFQGKQDNDLHSHSDLLLKFGHCGCGDHGLVKVSRASDIKMTSSRICTWLQVLWIQLVPGDIW